MIWNKSIISPKAAAGLVLVGFIFTGIPIQFQRKFNPVKILTIRVQELKCEIKCDPVSQTYH